MASLLKQSGRYYLQFYDAGKSPKRKRVALRTTRKRPAQAKRRELEDAYVSGAFKPWSSGQKGDPFEYEGAGRLEPLSLREALKRFLEAKEAAGRSPYTVKDYRYKIGAFARIAGEERQLEELAAADARAYCLATDVKQSTRKRRYLALSAFFEHFRGQGYFEEIGAPTDEMEPPRETETLPVVATESDLAAIEKAARQHCRKEGVRDGAVVWMLPLFRFALYTGLRISELARLRWRDVDPSGGVVRLEKQKSRKAGTSPLPPKAVRVLESVERSREPEAYVFASPRARTAKSRSAEAFRGTVSRAFTRWRKAAGLRERLTFHGLRRGFCTALARAGKSAYVIKRAARHADIATSMKYVRLAGRDLQKEVADVFG